MNIFQKLFAKKEPIPFEFPIQTPKIDLSTVKQFDDVWIKIRDNIYEGWVLRKEGNKLEIIFTDSEKQFQETSFIIERPLNRTVLEQKNKILILNKEEVADFQ